MKVLFIFAFFLATSCFAEENDTTVTPGPEPVTTTNLPTSSTNLPTTSSTSKTTTVEPIPTTSTEKPPTTLSTTTTAAATTTVAPTTNVPVTTEEPIPSPEEGSWNVTSGNTTCIRATLKILFKIPMGDSVKYLTLSPNSSTEGSGCDSSDGTQKLLLTDSNYNVEFIFAKDSDNVFVRNISLTYMLPPSETDTVENNTRLFSVRSGNSYLCTSEDTVMLSNVTMEIMSIKLQAFGAAGNTDFGSAEECDSDNKVNDVVPIAVGVALLTLVVVVLIAYLVGRRRSRQKGYQSV